MAIAMSANEAFAFSGDFSDVPSNHTFHDAIASCANQGITSGYADGTFKPGNTVTNAQFIVMLSRAFCSDNIGQNTGNNPWWYPNWKAMSDAGYVKNNDHFSTLDAMTAYANKGITRYDMADLMVSIMLQKHALNVSSAESNAAEAKIADYNTIPSDYTYAVRQVFAAGLITGYADGKFNGNATMTRGAGAAVIYRMQNHMGENQDAGTKPIEKPVETPTETPNQSSDKLVLRDGSAVTEENAMRIIQEVMAVYPEGADWGDSDKRPDLYGVGTGDRDNHVQIGGRTLGSLSPTLRQLENKYHYSMTGGCGGIAGVVSDAIFGGGNNGGQNFPIRRLENAADIRPGDIICGLRNGTPFHYAVATTRGVYWKTQNGVDLYKIGIYDGGGTVDSGAGHILYTQNGATWNGIRNGISHEIWTRYPESIPPSDTSSSAVSNNSNDHALVVDNTSNNQTVNTPAYTPNNTTPSNNPSISNSSLPDLSHITAEYVGNLPCKICGKLSKDCPSGWFGETYDYYVCGTCAQTPAGREFLRTH